MSVQLRRLAFENEVIKKNIPQKRWKYLYFEMIGTHYSSKV
jgi:hypothetical protein